MSLSKYDFVIIKSAGVNFPYYKIGSTKLFASKKEADIARDYIVKALEYYKKHGNKT